MEQSERKKLKEGLELFLNEGLERLTLSHPADPSGCSRSRIRPLLLKGELVFQAEEQVGRQAFHRNMTKEQAVSYICGMLDGTLRQAEMSGGWGTGVVLVSKKGKVTVKLRRKAARENMAEEANTAKIRPQFQEASALLEHNRRKRYILEEGLSLIHI